MKTTRQMIIGVTLCACLLTGLARSEETYSTLDGIGRGVANLFAGWLEIPRCMTFCTVAWPGVGIVPGALQGSGMTVVRTLGGLVDVCTLGYLSPGTTIYDSMEAPMLPWQGPWLPTKDNDLP